MNTPRTPPPIRPVERLGLALFLAAALHAILILGVGFGIDDLLREPPPRSMEVTLVHERDTEAPEEADLLAQASQRGGGTVEEQVRPSAPSVSETAVQQEGDAAESRPAQAPAPRQPVEEPLLMTAPEAEQRAAVAPEESPPELPETLTASELLPPSREVARLASEIRQRQQAYAKRSREKYISANTREYLYASYEESWRQKVERIGNLNYPDEAKRRNLSGSLILDVAIRADGTLHSVRVTRSSGDKVLDDGAVRIVRLASPFAPFPEEMRREIDVLHIVRTWQFQGESRLGVGP